MEEAKAGARFIRASVRKVKRILDLVRGKKVNEAQAILRYNPPRASKQVSKLVQSALNNARRKGMAEERLFIKEIYVTRGPRLRRARAGSRGKSVMINRPSSHLQIRLGEK